MDPIYLRPEAQLFYADMVHDRIKRQIDDEMEDLKEGQSLLVEVILHDHRVIVPTYFGYQNPNFILVFGEDVNGNRMKALIPHTDIQIVITVLNKPAERKPIGFQSRESTP